MGIGVGKKKIRKEQSTIGTIYIENRGDGKVKKDSVLKLILPAGNENLGFLKAPAYVSSSFVFKPKGSQTKTAIGNKVTNCTTPTQTANTYSFECKLTSDLAPGESGTITFDFTYRINDSAPEKNTVFAGGVDYTYENAKELSFPLVSVPPQ